MKQSILSITLLSLLVPFGLSAAAEVKETYKPTDSAWFKYKKDHKEDDNRTEYEVLKDEANCAFDNQKWEKAEELWKKILQRNDIPNKDRIMGHLVLAQAQFAQNKQSASWKYMDDAINIPREMQLPDTPHKLITMQREDINGPGNTVVVRGDQVGFGDNCHTAICLEYLQNSGFNVVMYMPKRGRDFVETPAQCFDNIPVIDTMEDAPPHAFEAHIMGLVGRFNLNPSDLRPDRPIYTVIDSVLSKVKALFDSIDGPIYLNLSGGQNAPEVDLIGGRRLNGRDMGPAGAIKLLETYPQLTLVDIGQEADNSAFKPSENVAHRVKSLPREGAFISFPTVIAAAICMNQDKERKIVAGVTDCGPANLLIRAGSDAIDRIAIFAKGRHDMRMAPIENDPATKRYPSGGMSSEQPLSGCTIYYYDTEKQLEDMTLTAYQDMTRPRGNG